MWSLVEHSFGKSEPFSQRNGYQMEEFLVKACSGMCWRLWEGLEADERNVLDAGDFTVKQETKAIKDEEAEAWNCKVPSPRFLRWWHSRLGLHIASHMCSWQVLQDFSPPPASSRTLEAPRMVYIYTRRKN
ncbi:hypothetical protein mRhiFer1_008431 [Rhinolophus ferrumequinum]|uniref:Uncharacterized protein n=1 Tax=Rhinolophus ferrumequinum TaxID=59479 RepID=A0A7J7V869_RHIFE|nr:hypothetical protein mRhiFer1_008431 [Rhinolophus ferrumequinum]